MISLYLLGWLFGKARPHLSARRWLGKGDEPSAIKVSSASKGGSESSEQQRPVMINWSPRLREHRNLPLTRAGVSTISWVDGGQFSSSHSPRRPLDCATISGRDDIKLSSALRNLISRCVPTDSNWYFLVLRQSILLHFTLQLQPDGAGEEEKLIKICCYKCSAVSLRTTKKLLSLSSGVFGAEMRSPAVRVGFFPKLLKCF